MMVVDVRTGRPQRRCQDCGTDAYHRVVAAECRRCRTWFAFCDRCGGGEAVVAARREHRREEHRP